ncbi:MAG: hypothetical protein ACRECR_04055, partial [Thermoplasmata archaeon]
MERFGSLMVNEAELATTGLRRLLITEPHPGHREILRAPGLSEERLARGRDRLDGRRVGLTLRGAPTST